jgi:DNA-binding IclR family transcriptional regulator
MSPRDGVGVLARAAAILNVIEIRPMGASELSRELGLSVSTTYRLASEMVHHGLLRKDDEARFHLGHRFTASAVADLSLPALRALAETTGESAQLWTRRGDFRLCSASVESNHELRVTMPVGALLPLPAGSAGHILSGEWERDPVAVQRGWWMSVSERTPGLASVSAPVRAHGEISAAVCVAGPIDRIGTSPGETIGDAVVATARRIEDTLPVT